MRLLSVDWDYFVPSIDQEFIACGLERQAPYALGTGEGFTDDMLDALWDTRLALLRAFGLPLPGTSGAERDFWGRFCIDPDASLFYADSHAQAAQAPLRQGTREVWNYDAHHDAGYEGAVDDPVRLGWVGCANWMCAYHLAGARLRVRYPGWRHDALQREIPPLCPVDRSIDPGGPVDLSFQLVFLCRSSAWTPPWLDSAFDTFRSAAPVSRHICLDRGWRRRQIDPGWIRHMQQSVPSL